MLTCLAVFSSFFLVDGRNASEPPLNEITPNEITVYVDQPTVDLPETLYGLFYEDINYAADGGLYAELVQNRSFEYYPVQGWSRMSDQLTPLFSWEKVGLGGGKVSLSVESKEPLNTNNRNYLRIHIESAGSGVGVANTGFDGIYVEEGETYDVSFYARREENLEAPVRVSIEGDAGTLGEVVIDELSPDWSLYEAAIEVAKTDERARLQIVTTGEGDVFLDMISLFPRKTFKERKNGLRPDLVQALIDLKPATFRFPGGCITHGHGLENAYRWKDTIGDVAQRKPNWNLWGYHQTYGLGYFEYFQLCEDIGAAPVPILPLGISCGFREPFQNESLDRLQEWVDDALDLVEFANGSIDSEWGSVRAHMGHPEPFDLEFIGLGNEEHHTEDFEERFPVFVRAIRERYPEIQIIGTSGLGHQIPIYEFMTEQGVDITDEHYYEAPQWFMANQHRFDGFDREKPKIYVGEYASRGNRLENAVAEACYLTGVERNADMVVMTAYAPLFARYRFTQWTAADLIWFDHKTVVRTPNYWVQKMFSENKGDSYLLSESRFDQKPDPGSDVAPGKVGVGTWETSAVFDDICVRAQEVTLIEENFASDSGNWKVEAGDYAVSGGAYRQKDRDGTPAMSLCRTEIRDSEISYTLRAKKTGGREGFLILFGARDGAYYWWNIGGWQNTRHAIEKGGSNYREGKAELAARPGNIETNKWYDIRIEIEGARIRCNLNDELIHDVRPTGPEIGVAASSDKASGDIILKIANPRLEAYPTHIRLRGIDRVEATGQLTLLSGEKDDFNDLEYTERVRPVRRRLPVSTGFDYTIPPMSVQFVRIQRAR